MNFGRSIRARLLLGAGLVLLAFITGAGVAVQRAHADSVLTSHYARLQSTIYLLLAKVELDPAGTLVMSGELAEPRLSLPASGLYASITHPTRNTHWQSPSSLGVNPPLPRGIDPGQWRYDTVEGERATFLAATYGVTWTAGRTNTPLVLSVMEDKAVFDRELRVFTRTLWTWLGGAGVLLLLTQILLLRWALAPLRSVANEILRVESGAQARIEGDYPPEISGLTDNLNTLIQQERVRQTRYKEALSYLAHSLKTPLAVLRNTLNEPASLPQVVGQQVTRMDEIVQHQLGRAAAGGATRFAPPVKVRPILERIQDALGKVYAEKGLAFSVDCPGDLGWRIDEGDMFEMLGNVMDNAAKWARHEVRAKAWRQADSLWIRVDDDGPGFSDTESILQMHVRLDERVPGHGIGLAVVKDLVASHHGELKLSRADAGGARLEIVLPPA